MSKQEVKDEHKQSEGDPLVKQRIRMVARERARRRMIAEVPRATLVITNPTHYAVALRYTRNEGGAPLVIAKGQNLVALKIREIAERYDIPIVEDKPLARSLYDSVEVNKMIPSAFYKAVAEIIFYLHQRKIRN
jgi:flagellar biosynthetic protein FlhB